MGLWGSLVSLRASGARDPGANPGSPMTATKKNKIKRNGLRRQLINNRKNNTKDC